MIIGLIIVAILQLTSGGEPPKVQVDAGKPGAATEGKLALTEAMTYKIIKEFPHDPSSYTQGLQWHDGHLIESTGHRGRSRIRKVKLETGKPVDGLDFPVAMSLFAEGATVLGDKIYQLTWQAGIGFIYDAKTLKEVGRFRYPEDGKTFPKEGWGLTHNGEELIMSDGTAQIYFLDPKTFKQKRVIHVANAKGVPMDRLNELEYIQGEIWANVYTTEFIVRIDPKNGKLLGYVNFAGLKASGNFPRSAEVLNGIAFDPETQRIFITGKYWPKLYQVELVPLKR